MGAKNGLRLDGVLRDLLSADADVLAASAALAREQDRLSKASQARASASVAAFNACSELGVGWSREGRLVRVGANNYLLRLTAGYANLEPIETLEVE